MNRGKGKPVRVINEKAAGFPAAFVPFAYRGSVQRLQPRLDLFAPTLKERGKRQAFAQQSPSWFVHGETGAVGRDLEQVAARPAEIERAEKKPPRPRPSWDAHSVQTLRPLVDRGHIARGRRRDDRPRPDAPPAGRAGLRHAVPPRTAGAHLDRHGRCHGRPGWHIRAPCACSSPRQHDVGRRQIGEIVIGPSRGIWCCAGTGLPKGWRRRWARPRSGGNAGPRGPGNQGWRGRPAWWCRRRSGRGRRLPQKSMLSPATRSPVRLIEWVPRRFRRGGPVEEGQVRPGRGQPSA